MPPPLDSPHARQATATPPLLPQASRPQPPPSPPRGQLAASIPFFRDERGELCLLKTKQHQITLGVVGGAEAGGGSLDGEDDRRPVVRLALVTSEDQKRIVGGIQHGGSAAAAAAATTATATVATAPEVFNDGSGAPCLRLVPGRISPFKLAPATSSYVNATRYRIVVEEADDLHGGEGGASGGSGRQPLASFVSEPFKIKNRARA